MRKYFKAFKEQDITIADYRDYFKPNLCYLEGAWFHPNDNGNVEEPFDSDLHSIDATTWEDLQKKVLRVRHIFL